MFPVSPEPKVKPDVPCPSLNPSLWFNGQMDHIILYNDSPSAGCHGTVRDYYVKKGNQGLNLGGIRVWLDHLHS